LQFIISFAVIAILITASLLVIRWGRLKLWGAIPTKLFTLIAILFTSGLDVGLIMFPLTEFPVYATESSYEFANPLAIEFGFWGFLIWALYFVSTFYFCAIEPQIKLFEIRWVKFINNTVIIATCAFTGYLFLTYLPGYISGISDPLRYALVGLVVMLAVLSSTEMKYVKILSIASTWLFFALVATMWFAGDMGVNGLVNSTVLIGEYFQNIHRFVTPITDYHAFYLFWWFAWSIMIGQFVSRFVGGLQTWQLLLALMIFPSIPIAAWFSILYYYHSNGVDIGTAINIAMIVVGIIFVINSLDSLTRLYTTNLKLTVQELGKVRYIVVHWSLMFGLILLYQFTPLKIEWIGLIVIGLYACIYALIFHKRKAINL